MDFQQAVDTKVLKGVELWLSGIATTSTVWVYFRPRGCPGWSLAGTRTFNVPGGDLHRKTQFLLEFQSAANNEMDLDFAIVSS